MGEPAVPAPDPATAIEAAPICNGVVPNVFVKRTLTRSPPTLVYTMLRTVWLSKPVAAGVPGTAT